jgi:glycosyltransferase involved in cell wall biosynthesis
MPVVMQVIPSLNYGGVEQGVIDLNAGFSASGWKSIVVSNGGSRVQDVIAGGGAHIRLPVHTKNPLVMAANIGRLRKLIRDHQVEIVHACSRAPAWSAMQAVEGTRARFVTSCHSAHAAQNIAKRLYNSSIARGERVIAVSQFLADYLSENYGVERDRIRVVHRGVSLERFMPNPESSERAAQLKKSLQIPDNVPIILLPGRLTRSKGHVFLLDAVAHLRRKDVVVVFLGSLNDTYAGELRERAAAHGLSEQLHIHDALGDMPSAYMLADIVTAPSVWPEGFGRISIEAQAMGRPVIATNHGGARETILHGETGWLVKPGNIEDFAAALEKSLSLDPRARSEMGLRAMRHVADHFTNVKMCSETLRVYGELLAAPEAVMPRAA